MMCVRELCENNPREFTFFDWKVIKEDYLGDLVSVELEKITSQKSIN